MTNEEFIKRRTLEGEEWRDVVGFEGLYMVSNLGRILSIPRSRCHGGILNPSICPVSGYPYVGLRKDNRSIRLKLHQIVAKAWIPNPNNYPHIDHIDTDRTNASVSNLRWVTRTMNRHNPITYHRIARSRQKDKSKSSEIVSLQDNEIVKTYPYLVRVKEDGHCVQAVWRCLKGEKKHHHRLSWMYLSDYENLNINNVNVLLESGEE